jgi:hypothetical protein
MQGEGERTRENKVVERKWQRALAGGTRGWRMTVSREVGGNVDWRRGEAKGNEKHYHAHRTRASE